MLPDSWEIWLDAQISPIIAKWMAEYSGLNVKSSFVLGYKSTTDLSIYELAKAQGKVILVSKDADFAEIVTRLGSPPKLISIKLAIAITVPYGSFYKSISTQLYKCL